MTEEGRESFSRGAFYVDDGKAARPGRCAVHYENNAVSAVNTYSKVVICGR